MEGQSKPQNKALLRRRKGWIGFVHGYKDWVRACEEEGRWDNMEWGTNDKAIKSVEETPIGKKIYKF